MEKVVEKHAKAKTVLLVALARAAEDTVEENLVQKIVKAAKMT